MNRSCAGNWNACATPTTYAGDSSARCGPRTQLRAAVAASCPVIPLIYIERWRTGSARRPNAPIHSGNLRHAHDSQKICAIVSLLRSSRSSEPRSQASATGGRGNPPPPAAKAVSNERQAVIARIDANQAEASCKICKNCAIVLGLAVAEILGFTLIFR